MLLVINWLNKVLGTNIIHIYMDILKFAKLESRVLFNFKRSNFMICFSDLAPDWHFVAHPIQ